MTDLGKFPGTHSQISQANAINDKGQVTGYSYTSSGEYHAYLYDGGRMTDLGVPAGFNGSSYGFAINNKGRWQDKPPRPASSMPASTATGR